MKFRTTLGVILIALLCCGCTVDGGSVSEDDLNKVMVCTDTRDGEVFSFNTNTVTNVRQGFGAPHTMEVTTLNGDKRTLNSDMEVWLKCKAA